MLPCPRDTHALIQYADESGSLWRCGICSGAFFQSSVIRNAALEHRLARRAQWDREIKYPSDATKMRGLRYRNETVDISPSAAVSGWTQRRYRKCWGALFPATRLSMCRSFFGP